MKINSISPEKHKYLQGIVTIDVPPLTLFYIGTLPLERRPTLAVVGTRRPTRYGADVTETLVRELAQAGIIIVSGLALGVDAIAHRTTLEAHGTTLAVLANPLPRILPSTNRQLGERIVQQGGAVISEHSDDEPTHYAVGKWSFLERNRIVAGISDAILITEASARSGTLNTAMHALRQGKDVFVVPGNITSPSSAGCNALIRQGATPVTCAQDILDVLVPDYQAAQRQLPLGNTPAETAIIDCLSRDIHDANEIQRLSDIDPVELSTALSMLEITGVIKPLGANHWSLR